jgi:DNA-binding transcriptional LysR family regulator
MPLFHRSMPLQHRWSRVMEMHEIRYFLAACETLNFHRAADMVHVGQPALTRAIQKLELELGGFLFRREKAHVHLTDFGELMRGHLDDVLKRTEAAKRSAKTFLSLEASSLTLGVMCTIGPMRFIGFLNDFRERHPGIIVHVVDGVSGHLLDLLREGRLDIALLAQPDPFDEDLRTEAIYSERFGLACATGHSLAARNTVKLTDVRGEPYLERVNCEYGNHIDELCRAEGIEIRSTYRSEREDWILAMVAAGMGVCFVAEFSASLPGLCHRPVVDPEIVRHISIVSLNERPQSVAVTAFSEAARQYDWRRAVPHTAFRQA